MQDVLRGLPADAGKRKDTPITTGVLDYFPAALAEVARVSKAGNDQHNPGEPLHWARGKSSDHADCLLRHMIDRGSRDKDGHRHTAKVAWRALALLQEEIEAEAGFVPQAQSMKAAGEKIKKEMSDVIYRLGEPFNHYRIKSGAYPMSPGVKSPAHWTDGAMMSYAPGDLLHPMSEMGCAGVLDMLYDYMGRDDFLNYDFYVEPVT